MKTEQQTTKFTVTRQAISEVYDSVCQEWKHTINILLASQRFNSDISLDYRLVKKAHENSKLALDRKKVKEWLNKYLPLPTKKKIELHYCLQTTGDWYDCSRWDLCLDSVYKKCHPMKFKGENYDVIITEAGVSEYINVYLGHWNDGVTED